MAEIDSRVPAGNEAEFLSARARSIDAYASIEASLTYLLGTLLKCGPHIPFIIFEQVVNTKSRNMIFERIIKAEHAAYSTYWFGVPGKQGKGLLGHLRDIDGTRNQIVHWHSIRIAHDKWEGGELVLRKASFWVPPAKGPPSEITVADMEEFITEANFIRLSIQTFNRIFSLGMVDPQHDTWRDICLQPYVYPPPSNHPLLQMQSEP